MKRDRFIRFLLILITMYLIARIAYRANAYEKPEEFKKIRVTFYTDNQNLTADGSRVREGICAMNNYYLGATVLLYKIQPDGSIGELIGIYEVKDTGSNQELKQGKRVDLWMPSEQLGWELMKDIQDFAYIQILWDCVG